MTSRGQSSSTGPRDDWLLNVEEAMTAFVAENATTLKRTERELAAYFEIGCFLSLVRDYEAQGICATAENLKSDGAFRYLTTPSGNPNNFSYVVLNHGNASWQVRQQVRVVSHLHPDVALTPDIVVLDATAEIVDTKDTDFAHGKRGFFRVQSAGVVAAHECKSLTAFPELYASFVGLALLCHDWMDSSRRGESKRCSFGHLAPTLFVGGDASNLHRRMVKALEGVYPINIVVGLHQTGVAWRKGKGTLARLPLHGAWLQPFVEIDARPLQDPVFGGS